MTTTFAIDARAYGERFPGIGRYIGSILPALVPHIRRSERLIYLCSREQRERLALPDDPRAQWVEANVSPFGLRQQWQIPRLLRAHGATVYHSPYYLMPYWPGVATVLTVYDLIPMLFPDYVSRRARLFFRLTTRLALRRAARIIAISQATRQDFLSHFGIDSQDVTSIPLAAHPRFRPSSRDDMAQVRDKFALGSGYVLYVGSNKPHKNLTALVRAWRRVPDDVRETRVLVIAGRWDPSYPEVVAEVGRLRMRSGVRLLHDVADLDLPALYSGADLFVFPSLYEGFGLPVLEAMACGCAVACSRVSSLPEVAGDAALLFDPHEPSAIAGAIAALLREPPLRQVYQRKAIQRSASFSWDRAALETARLYRHVADLYPPYTRHL